MHDVCCITVTSGDRYCAKVSSVSVSDKYLLQARFENFNVIWRNYAAPSMQAGMLQMLRSSASIWMLVFMQFLIFYFLEGEGRIFQKWHKTPVLGFLCALPKFCPFNLILNTFELSTLLRFNQPPNPRVV